MKFKVRGDARSTPVVITPGKPKIAETGLTGFWPIDVLLVGLYNLTLVKAIVRRDIETRYRGSFMGTLWLVVVPLTMLVAYTFVFTRVFSTKFPGVHTVRETALAIYSGMIIYGFFSEAVGRAPTLIADVPALVKRVVFPLRIIPLSAILTAGTGALISLTLLFVLRVVVGGTIPWTILLAPLVLVPVGLFTLGVSWALAAAGVFIRDIRHVTGVMLTFLMFVTPVFYSAESISGNFRKYVYLNPLSYALESFRAMMFEGRVPDPFHLLVYTVFCWLCAVAGYGIFATTQRHFADVI